MSNASGSVGSTLTRSSAHALSYDSPSSRTSIFSGSSHVDRDGFLQSEHRAGGPYLCSLPAFTRLVSAEYDRRTRYHDLTPRLRADTEAILVEEGISYEFVSITGRQSKVDPEPEPVPTVLVVTERNSRRVAKRIHQALAPLVSNICVELIGDALLKPFRCFPVSPSESIFHKWEKICESILSRSDILEWTALECWRYGTSGDPIQNPVTVVVSVLKSSTSQFYTATQRIRGLLAQQNESDVAILFQKDEIKRHVENPLIPRQACTLPAQPGVSLGIHSSSAGSSTLGGIVQLRSPDNEWHSFGMTCFHCVYAPENHRESLNPIQHAGEAFRKWMFSPVLPGDAMAKMILNVDHPSVPDLRRTIEDINSKIEDFRDAEFRRIERQIQQREASSVDAFVTGEEEQRYHMTLRVIAFLESERHHFQQFLDDRAYFLGPVFAGSGLYRKEARNDDQDFLLDWALIQIRQERLGKNKPFLYGATTQQLVVAGLPLEAFFKQEKLLKATNSEMVVFKSGRSTSITQAKFHGLKSVLITREPIPMYGTFRLVTTWEYAFASISEGPFAEPGDSGTFVSTRLGGVVGLLWGGAERNDIGYVTPIEAVFDDIKKVTGAVEVRIAS